MEKSNANPQLRYRIEKSIQDAYKEACEKQAIDPGKQIRKWMLEFIEKSKNI